MREIKFRAKRLDNGNWCFGLLVPLDMFKDPDYLAEYWMSTGHEDQCFPIISKTIGQFTGLKDRNRVDIYEDDILKGFQKEQIDEEGRYGFEIKDKVIFRYGFSVFGRPLDSCYTNDQKIRCFMWHEPGNLTNRNGRYYQIEEIEVIGNIHDNPELLNHGS